jgi:hypothetical protein
MTGPKIGLIDIETAPLNADVWALFDQNVGLNQINVEWSILSFCFKELHAPKRDVLYMDTQGNPRDDSGLLPVLWQIMHEFDFLIAQNGKRFDMRKIRARLILNGFEPPSPVKVMDTMLMARKAAAFTSNKLEWLSTYLSSVQKSKHKDFPGHELWAECLKDNAKAWASMRRYNIPDVLSMEQVYLNLRPWASEHNIAAYTDHEDRVCPICLSHDLTQDGHYFTGVSQYNRYRCNGCGAWSRDRFTINSRDKRKSLLVGV